MRTGSNYKTFDLTCENTIGLVQINNKDDSDDDSFKMNTFEHIKDNIYL